MLSTMSQRPAEILLVDDDRLFLDTLEEMLLENGYRVETAGDGFAAYQKLKERAFDMVLTDLHMPVMNGLELLDRISRDHIPVAPVLMSSLLSGDIKTDAVRKGAFAHLDKPFSSGSLFSIIESTMHRKQRKAA